MRELDVEITYLVMPINPAQTLPEFGDFQIDEYSPITVKRFLDAYQHIGAAYHWVDMLALPPSELEAYCGDAKKTLFELKSGEALAGFVVLHEQAQVTDLAYFGLAQDFIGQGLGGKWLDFAINKAWQRKDVTSLTVNTCTLDHPHALSLYLSRGFVITHKKMRRMKLDQKG